jgi:L-ornithine N5-oxygenase
LPIDINDGLSGFNMNFKSLKLLGVGFGPSNLALATALEEIQLNSSSILNCLFLEKNSTFRWHSGMLIPDMVLQVPFLRDLATIRNPQSPFTFLNYLKEKNRLDAFINLRTFYPTRVEFHDYLSWASSKLSHMVKFNTEVKAIAPLWDKETQTILKLTVTCFDNNTEQTTDWQTDNLVLSAGKTPSIPAIIEHLTDEKIVHTSQLLHKIPPQFPDFNKDYRFIVVGSGQSAGEAALYLLRHYPNASLALCFRSFSLCSIDNSPYVNQMYHHQAIENFYQLGVTAKEKAHDNLKMSNYSVIDNEILCELFNIQYKDALDKKARLTLCPGFEFKGLTASPTLLEVEFHDIYNDISNTLKSDALILATGYNDNNCIKLLTELDPHLKKCSTNTYEVKSDYQIKTDDVMQPKIYLQGYCEHSHGPSDPTLAVLSTRAEVILDSIRSSTRMCNAN